VYIELWSYVVNGIIIFSQLYFVSAVSCLDASVRLSQSVYVLFDVQIYMVIEGAAEKVNKLKSLPSEVDPLGISDLCSYQPHTRSCCDNRFYNDVTVNLASKVHEFISHIHGYDLQYLVLVVNVKRSSRFVCYFYAIQSYVIFC